MNDTYAESTFELSGMFERFIAFIIDGFLFGLIGGLLGIGGNWLGGGLVGFLAGTAYQWYFLTQHNGQTPGKMLLGLQVIKTDGTEIADFDAVIRAFGQYIGSAIMFIGFFWAFFDSQNQGWHDKLARTYVIKKPKNSDTRKVKVG